MWKGPSGTADGPESSDINQQLTEFKELLRKNDQTTLTQEKANELANTLSKMNARVKKNHGKEAKSASKNPANEKVLLLKQQLEQNKAKLAERGKNQKGIEEMVTQIKAQLDETQFLTPLNISLIDDRVDYSPQTSAQELYNILLNKDKRISELNAKISKLEANIIDLQENVKEKDSVIDARTKAITLMSENLSKKGKSTLDTLDETKEQMRRMQETFVEMEEAMKIEQNKLRTDLERRSNELNQLRVQHAGQDDKLLELQHLCAQLDDADAPPLDETITSDNRCDILINLINNYLNRPRTISDEVVKLKQQLDESNKTMIKVKAQHKSKIKELNKKIDAFKKMGDLNAAIVRLEGDNSKLEQRIAELEEEKGQLQLNMVDSKDSVNLEDLETKLGQHVEQLAAKNEEIAKLTLKNQQYEEDIRILNDKVANLTALKNDQIKSDLTSIQYEETIERLETEKAVLIAEKHALEDERLQINEQLDQAKKEKQELSVKLDQYMHENIDLLDRLEKLSAEKVSSAESIEIVENLTAQEKLELETYQKQHDDQDHDSDLNESVNQLNEETTELLGKIELFTVERREVMEKMELLASENNQLQMKIKEIENNRDVLIETYEQLQNDKDVLDAKYSHDIAQLNAHIDEYKALIDVKEQEVRDMKVMLIEFETKQRDENDECKSPSSSANEDADALKQEIIDLQTKLRRLESAHINLQNIALDSVELQHENIELKMQQQQQDNFDDLQRECVSLRTQVDNLQTQLDVLQDDYAKLQNLMQYNEFERENIQLKGKIHTIFSKLIVSDDKDINALRKLCDVEAKIDENLSEINYYKTLIEDNKNELIESSNLISDLQEKLNAKTLEIEHYMNIIDNFQQPDESAFKNELDALKLALNENLAQTVVYEREIVANSQHLNALHVEMNEMKILIDSQTKEIEDKDAEIGRLNNKDSEFVEQMNALKTRCVSLEKQISERGDTLTPLQKRIDELEVKNKEQLEKMKKIAANLKKKSGECKELQGKIEKFEAQVQELTNQLQNNASELKVADLELYIENQDVELGKYKERCAKLEEGLFSLEERRLCLENRTVELTDELQHRKNVSDEATQKGDYLEHRLAILAEHDRTIEAKLNEMIVENQRQQHEIINLRNECDTLRKQIENVNGKLHDDESVKNELVQENEQLNNAVALLQNELKRIGGEYENAKFALERNESEQQEQIEQLQIERKLLLEQFEIAKDQVTNLQEAKDKWSDDLQALNSKLDAQQNDYDDLSHKYHQLQVEHNKSLVMLDELSPDDNLQHDISELEASIERKRVDLVAYQQEFANNPANFFETPQTHHLEHEINNLSLILNGKRDKLRNRHGSDDKLVELQQKLDESVEELAEAKSQIDFSKNMIRTLEETNLSLLGRSDDLERQLFDQQNQLTESKVHTLESTPTTAPLQVVATDNLLEQKVKTLEFLLHDMEKEKDSALLQCDELSHELAQLIYERQSEANTVNNAEIEAQILSGNEVTLPGGKVPCEPIRMFHSDDNEGNEAEIVEELCVKKDAYKCQPDVEDVQEQECKQSHAGIEEAFNVPQQSGAHYSEAFTTETLFHVGAQPQPDSTKSIPAAFEENDDGWVWGKEAQSEHLLNELQEKIRVLNLEREQHLEEIKQAQIKSGKLIKKLKEFKAKNEQLNLKIHSKDDFGGLDDAIQDEFKAQIASLEKRIKEVTGELDKERLEKDNLLKRIDTLTAANERFVEMKEKQDVELMAWQQRNRELATKLEQFEWGDDSVEVTNSTQKPPSSTNSSTEFEAKIIELNDTIKDLTLDNEELQTLLEEQRNLRLEAEKSKPHDADNVKAQLDGVNSKLAEVMQQLQQNYAEKTQLEATILDNNLTIEALNQQLGELIDLDRSKTHELDELKIKLDGMQQEKFSIESQMKTFGNNQQNELKLLNDELTARRDDVAKLQAELSGKDEEFRAHCERLVAEWSQHVDRRGNDVAESWKLHLETRENEFMQMEQQLRKQIYEIEEKYNALVNENNELRKNVDAEIRNEVDRIAAIQQQIIDKEQKINELSEEMNAVKEENTRLVNENNELAQTCNNKDEIINTLSASKQALEANVDNLMSEAQHSTHKDEIINDLSASNSDLEAKISQLLTDLQNSSNKDEVINNLTCSNAELQEKVNQLLGVIEQSGDKDVIITNLSLSNSELEAKINQLLSDAQHSSDKDDIINNLTLSNSELETKINQLLSDSQNYNQKDEMIASLTANNHELDTKINCLFNELAEQQALTAKLHQDNEANISSKNEVIEQLRDEIKKLRGELEALEITLHEKQQNVAELTISIDTLQAQINNLNVQLSDNHMHVDTLQQEIDSYKTMNDSIQNKDIELSRLSNLMDEREREYYYSLQSKELESQSMLGDLNNEIDALKRHLDEMHAQSTAKDVELDSYRLQLNEIAEKEQRLVSLVSEDEKQLAELKNIIEDQVMKIEELKHELYAKSSDYDALIAELNAPHELKQSVSDTNTTTISSQSSASDNLADPVSRAELDLALYMLHQRDVRCEELTVELMQLLEERDTLQLRLSNALREKEELRNKTHHQIIDDTSALEQQQHQVDAAQIATTSSNPTGAIPRSRQIILGATGTELAAEATEQLANKLSELKNVGYHKDKTIVDEQEVRRLQQFAILEQHKDELAKLPPEAASRLVDASYTLSRDVQSPSKVLLNWLWGRSTPKVNNI